MRFPTQPIFIVDDEPVFLQTSSLILRSAGYDNIITISDSRTLIEKIAEHKPRIITLDLNMPHIDGETLLEKVKDKFPDISIIVVTALMEIETAVRCMQKGASDFLLKPVDPERLKATLHNFVEKQDILNEVENLKHAFLNSELKNPDAFKDIITDSPEMKRLFAYAEAISQTTLPVLVTGDTGTGKESMAKALHKVKHPDAPFVALNVAGFDDTMFSDALFGHVKGAFTGAQQDRPGFVEKAAGGTLFLDEIGDLKPESQVKLLRLIQEREYYPLGSDKKKTARIWLVAATNQHISHLENFRQDLYFRLKSHKIDLPALKDRKEDLIPLIRHFGIKAAEIYQKELPDAFFNLVQSKLKNYSFPGNIRELEGYVMDLAGTWVPTMADAMPPQPPIQSEGQPPGMLFGNEIKIGPEMPNMQQIEKYAIEEALRRTENNKKAAAEMLGITRQTLQNKVNTWQKAQKKVN